MESQELANKIVTLLDDKKAVDVCVYDMRGHSSVTDFNVVATGLSAPHLRALVGDLRGTLKAEGVPGYRASGEPESGWVVLDYIDVVVHVFTREAREYYDLDGLWKDRK